MHADEIKSVNAIRVNMQNPNRTDMKKKSDN